MCCLSKKLGNIGGQPLRHSKRSFYVHCESGRFTIFNFNSRLESVSERFYESLIFILDSLDKIG